MSAKISTTKSFFINARELGREGLARVVLGGRRVFAHKRLKTDEAASFG